MSSINVYEQALPGLGHRFELEMDDGRVLLMVVLRDGRRQLALRASDDDAADTLIEFDHDQAVTVGALLLGAQFSVASPAEPESADQVVVETITIADDAPTLGKTATHALRAFGRDVAVLAVIRDQTVAIVEHDPDLALCAGDRVAIAARRRCHAGIVRTLNGSAPPVVGTR